MAAGDEKQDELEKLFGKSDSSSAPSPPGQFTRAFFGVEQAKPQSPAEAPREHPDPQPANPSYPQPASTPSEFARIFGRPSADSQSPALSAEERPQPAMQNGFPSSEPGTSTGLFVAPSQVPPKTSAQAPPGHSDPQPAIPSYPRTAATSSEFTRIFGRPSADSQSPTLSAEERPQPAMQNGFPSSEPGTSTGLFAAPSQVPPKTSSPQPSTFTAFFHSELPAVGPVQSSADFRPLSPSVGPSPSADASGRVLPGINSLDAEKSKQDIGTGLAPFPEPNPGQNQEKATRLFSMPQAAADRPAPKGGPSAFTRIIDSSAQRSAEEKPDSSAAPASNSAPQGAGAPMIPAPVVAPQWPISSMPAPVHPAGYLPQQPIPPQMAMPPAASVAWPQAPPPPAVQMQQPYMQSDEQTQQKWWIAYLPLIIGLNLLFFLAVILILIFALTR